MRLHWIMQRKDAIHLYVQEWVQALHRHDKMSYVLLHDILVRQLKLISEAAHINGKDTFSGWKATFLSNENLFLDSMLGKHFRSGALLNLNCLDVRENANKIDSPNMTTLLHFTSKKTALQLSMTH